MTGPGCVNAWAGIFGKSNDLYGFFSDKIGRDMIRRVGCGAVAKDKQANMAMAEICR
jgi:hypothetical protein